MERNRGTILREKCFLLQLENEILKDENLALRLELSELKENFLGKFRKNIRELKP